MKELEILLPILLLVSSYLLAAPVIIVGPAEDNDCQYQTVNDAMAALSGQPNMIIRVAGDSTKAIFIDNEDVKSLVGGYATCADALTNSLVNDFQRTTVFEPGLPKLHIYHNNNADDMHISGFDIQSASIIDGGIPGVLIESTAASAVFNLSLNNFYIHDIQGSGIDVKGVKTLLSIENTTIGGNHTLTSGGGILCDKSIVTLGENTLISDNSAEFGGGIHATNCQINIFTGSPNWDDDTGIYNNSASKNGGGFYLNKSRLDGSGSVGFATQILYNLASSEDPEFGRGGAIYLSAGSSALLNNVIIGGNSASSSGGAFASTYDPTSNLTQPIIAINSHSDGCEYAEICSIIYGNTVGSNSTNGGYGSVLSANYGGIFSFDHTAIGFNGGEFGSKSIIDVRNSSYVAAASSLFYHNNAENLFYSKRQSTSEIEQSTFVDNNVTSYFNLQVDANTEEMLDLFTSIVANNPGQKIIETNNGNHQINASCSLVKEDFGTNLPAGSALITDPLFINEANFDYRLQANSPAINQPCINDNVSQASSTDIRQVDRTVNNLIDIGAYERIPEDDIIFKHGFE